MFIPNIKVKEIDYETNVTFILNYLSSKKPKYY